MLAADDSDDGDFWGLVDEALGELVAEVRDPGRIGERIGPYRLVRLLGEGGMGAVYLGERADEAYEGQVAIKLLRPTLFPRQAKERFRAERQILAHLSGE